MGARKITIVGGGPAGLTAGIFLGMQNIPVTIIEKDHYPRDKICGDCLGGYTISVISQINDRFFNDFVNFGKKSEGRGVHFFGPRHQRISVPSVNLVRDRISEVVLAKRMDFDNFLYQEASRYPSIEFINGVRIEQILRNKSGIRLQGNHHQFIMDTDLIILASGSIRNLGRQLTGEKMNKKQYATGIRAYFENVSPEGDPGYIELHFLKDLAPGYLWIFPLPDNTFNVGLGLRTDTVARKGLDLKQVFYQILEKDEYFRMRFSGARQLEAVKGFPLALGGNVRRLSGDHFLLAGDAGHLIEPLFGEGIGHAMYSGKFAAEHAVKCIKNDDFSDSFNRAYDRQVYDKLGTTLKFSKWMNRVARYPALMEFLFNRVEGNDLLRQHLFGIINGQIPKTPFHGIRLITQLVFGR